MNERLETKKYVFTVEGETERWYLYRLRDVVNACEKRIFNLAVDVKVQQRPKKFYKRVNAKTVPKVFHICDIESSEPVHTEKFQNILSEMKEATIQKGIRYELGYSNYTFELWMILHKKNCNGRLNHRRQYLEHINAAYEENFEDLDQYKHKSNFQRCLSKLELSDVLEAVRRADIKS